MGISNHYSGLNEYVIHHADVTVVTDIKVWA